MYLHRHVHTVVYSRYSAFNQLLDHAVSPSDMVKTFSPQTDYFLTRGLSQTTEIFMQYLKSHLTLGLQHW